MSLIKCPNCGRDVSDRARTCPNCGCSMKSRPINNPNNLVQCPECGALVDSNVQSCPNCGAPINNNGPFNPSYQQPANVNPQQNYGPPQPPVNQPPYNSYTPDSEENSATTIVVVATVVIIVIVLIIFGVYHNNTKPAATTADSDTTAVDTTAIDTTAVDTTSALTDSTDNSEGVQNSYINEQDNSELDQYCGSYRLFQKNDDGSIGFTTLAYITINSNNTADIDFLSCKVHYSKCTLDNEILYLYCESNPRLSATFRAVSGELYPLDEKRDESGCATVFIKKE